MSRSVIGSRSMLTISLGKGMVSGVSLRRGKDRLVRGEMGLWGSSSADVLLIANQSLTAFIVKISDQIRIM